MLPQTDTGKIYVMGHSLGAAMAAVAAVRMQHLFHGTEYSVGGVWLFGCPRVGNEEWMRVYNRRLLTRTLRFTNYADVVARLPGQQQFCTSMALRRSFTFRHIGRSVLLCPDIETGLVDWRLRPNGTEVVDCGVQPDRPDIALNTHWLGAYFDAWRRGHASASGTDLGKDPYIKSVVCDECSLSFPHDHAKQLNVIARAGGPVGCSSAASCSRRDAWSAVADVGGEFAVRFNPASACVGYVCT